MSLGDTISAFAIAVASDIAKAMTGLAVLAIVITGLSLIWNVGGKQFGNKIRENLAQIAIGIALTLTAAGTVAFFTASIGGG
jgi:nitrogen fixation-related uncharacterized protein